MFFFDKSAAASLHERKIGHAGFIARYSESLEYVNGACSIDVQISTVCKIGVRGFHL